MKSKIAGVLFALVAVAILFDPSQGWSQRGFGPPGGGDPGRVFDMLSRGRGYFLAEDMRQLREPMTQWLNKRGITDGKVTRELFTSFQEEMRANPAGMMTMFKGGPGSFAFKGPGFSGGFPGGGMPGPGGIMPFMPGGGPGRGSPSSELSMAELTRWGEMEFRRKDYNTDNVLTPEEAEPKLRESLQTWDTNRDGVISLDEFQSFFRAKMQTGGQGAKYNPVTIIIEEELLDKRPTMFRAGKDMPRELKWFSQLDVDKDGQVSFYEWRKAKKNRDDFTEYDRNADGLMTAEEALYYQKKNGSSAVASKSSSESPGVAAEMKKGPQRPDGGNKKGKGNFSEEDRAKWREEMKAKMMKTK